MWRVAGAARHLMTGIKVGTSDNIKNERVTRKRKSVDVEATFRGHGTGTTQNIMAVKS